MLTNRLLKDFNGFYSWVTPSPYEMLGYYDNLWKVEDGNYTMRLNIPGYGREDVTAKVVGEVLTLKIAETKSFSYRLPKRYDLASAKISVDKGVLTISVPPRVEDVSNEIQLIIS
jgi:HSP20 family molecular chaperone IbpA